MPERQPGYAIIDRHCPSLTDEERESARTRLQALASAIVRIEARVRAAAIPNDDSTPEGAGDTIPSLPPP